jgi:hypothetical protein
MDYRGFKLFSTTALAGVTAALIAAPADAATPSLTGAHIIADFSYGTKQQPENLALESNGSADLTFNFSLQVGRVTTTGALTNLSTLPEDSGDNALVSGIIRLDSGSLLVNYNAGTSSGVWSVPADGGTATQLVSIPGAGWLNGMTYDPSKRVLYLTDSTLGEVWKVSLSTDTASVWATGTALQPGGTPGSKGANGIKLYNGAIYVGNTSAGTLLRIPIDADGTAGPTSTVASGLTGIDDFAFTGDGYVIAAQNPANEVSIVNPSTGTSTIALTSTDGLDNPTSIAVSGSTVYITNGAYLTGSDPNLMLATYSG